MFDLKVLSLITTPSIGPLPCSAMLITHPPRWEAFFPDRSMALTSPPVSIASPSIAAITTSGPIRAPQVVGGIDEMLEASRSAQLTRSGKVAVAAAVPIAIAGAVTIEVANDARGVTGSMVI